MVLANLSRILQFPCKKRADGIRGFVLLTLMMFDWVIKIIIEAYKNTERHIVHTIVSWPNPKQWVIVHTSDSMMIIRQSIYILSIITRELGQLKTHSLTCFVMDNWENVAYLTHTLDKLCLTGILWVLYLQISLHNVDDEMVKCSLMFVKWVSVITPALAWLDAVYILCKRKGAIVRDVAGGSQDGDIHSTGYGVILII